MSAATAAAAPPFKRVDSAASVHDDEKCDADLDRESEDEQQDDETLEPSAREPLPAIKPSFELMQLGADGADCTVVVVRTDETERVLLVNTGTSLLGLPSALAAKGITRVDLVLVTHGDATHFGGLQGYISTLHSASPEFDGIRDLLKDAYFIINWFGVTIPGPNLDASADGATTLQKKKKLNAIEALAATYPGRVMDSTVRHVIDSPEGSNSEPTCVPPSGFLVGLDLVALLQQCDIADNNGLAKIFEAHYLTVTSEPTSAATHWGSAQKVLDACRWTSKSTPSAVCVAHQQHVVCLNADSACTAAKPTVASGDSLTQMGNHSLGLLFCGANSFSVLVLGDLDLSEQEAAIAGIRQVCGGDFQPTVYKISKHRVSSSTVLKQRTSGFHVLDSARSGANLRPHLIIDATPESAHAVVHAHVQSTSALALHTGAANATPASDSAAVTRATPKQRLIETGPSTTQLTDLLADFDATFHKAKLPVPTVNRGDVLIQVFGACEGDDRGHVEIHFQDGPKASAYVYNPFTRVSVPALPAVSTADVETHPAKELVPFFQRFHALAAHPEVVAAAAAAAADTTAAADATTDINATAAVDATTADATSAVDATAIVDATAEEGATNSVTWPGTYELPDPGLSLTDFTVSVAPADGSTTATANLRISTDKDDQPICVPLELSLPKEPSTIHQLKLMKRITLGPSDTRPDFVAPLLATHQYYQSVVRSHGSLLAESLVTGLSEIVLVVELTPGDHAAACRLVLELVHTNKNPPTDSTTKPDSEVDTNKNDNKEPTSAFSLQLSTDAKVAGFKTTRTLTGMGEGSILPFYGELTGGTQVRMHLYPDQSTNVGQLVSYIIPGWDDIVKGVKTAFPCIPDMPEWMGGQVRPNYVMLRDVWDDVTLTGPALDLSNRTVQGFLIEIALSDIQGDLAFLNNQSLQGSAELCKFPCLDDHSGEEKEKWRLQSFCVKLVQTEKSVGISLPDCPLGQLNVTSVALAGHFGTHSSRFSLSFEVDGTTSLPALSADSGSSGNSPLVVQHCRGELVLSKPKDGAVLQIASGTLYLLMSTSNAGSGEGASIRGALHYNREGDRHIWNLEAEAQNIGTGRCAGQDALPSLSPADGALAHFGALPFDLTVPTTNSPLHAQEINLKYASLDLNLSHGPSQSLEAYGTGQVHLDYKLAVPLFNTGDTLRLAGFAMVHIDRPEVGLASAEFKAALVARWGAHGSANVATQVQWVSRRLLDVRFHLDAFSLHDISPDCLHFLLPSNNVTVDARYLTFPQVGDAAMLQIDSARDPRSAHQLVTLISADDTNKNPNKVTIVALDISTSDTSQASWADRSTFTLLLRTSAGHRSLTIALGNIDVAKMMSLGDVMQLTIADARLLYDMGPAVQDQDQALVPSTPTSPTSTSTALLVSGKLLLFGATVEVKSLVLRESKATRDWALVGRLAISTETLKQHFPILSMLPSGLQLNLSVLKPFKDQESAKKVTGQLVATFSEAVQKYTSIPEVDSLIAPGPGQLMLQLSLEPSQAESIHTSLAKAELTICMVIALPGSRDGPDEGDTKSTSKVGFVLNKPASLFRDSTLMQGLTLAGFVDSDGVASLYGYMDVTISALDVAQACFDFERPSGLVENLLDNVLSVTLKRVEIQYRPSLAYFALSGIVAKKIPLDVKCQMVGKKFGFLLSSTGTSPDGEDLFDVIVGAFGDLLAPLKGKLKIGSFEVLKDWDHTAIEGNANDNGGADGNRDVDYMGDADDKGSGWLTRINISTRLDHGAWKLLGLHGNELAGTVDIASSVLSLNIPVTDFTLGALDFVNNKLLLETDSLGASVAATIYTPSGEPWAVFSGSFIIYLDGFSVRLSLQEGNGESWISFGKMNPSLSALYLKGLFVHTKVKPKSLSFSASAAIKIEHPAIAYPASSVTTEDSRAMKAAISIQLPGKTFYVLLSKVSFMNFLALVIHDDSTLNNLRWIDTIMPGIDHLEVFCKLDPMLELPHGFIPNVGNANGEDKLRRYLHDHDIEQVGIAGVGGRCKLKLFGFEAEVFAAAVVGAGSFSLPSAALVLEATLKCGNFLGILQIGGSKHDMSTPMKARLELDTAKGLFEFQFDGCLKLSFIIDVTIDCHVSFTTKSKSPKFAVDTLFEISVEVGKTTHTLQLKGAFYIKFQKLIPPAAEKLAQAILPESQFAMVPTEIGAALGIACVVTENGVMRDGDMVGFMFELVGAGFNRVMDVAKEAIEAAKRKLSEQEGHPVFGWFFKFVNWALSGLQALLGFLQKGFNLIKGILQDFVKSMIQIHSIHLGGALGLEDGVTVQANFHITLMGRTIKGGARISTKDFMKTIADIVCSLFTAEQGGCKNPEKMLDQYSPADGGEPEPPSFETAPDAPQFEPTNNATPEDLEQIQELEAAIKELQDLKEQLARRMEAAAACPPNCPACKEPLPSIVDAEVHANVCPEAAVRCYACQKQFKRKDAHKCDVAPAESECSKCGKKTTNFDYHLKTECKAVDAVLQWQPCALCQQHVMPDAMEAHLETVCRSNTQPCPDCGVEVQVFMLGTHAKYHCAQGELICNLCLAVVPINKALSRSQRLAAHREEACWDMCRKCHLAVPTSAAGRKEHDLTCGMPTQCLSPGCMRKLEQDEIPRESTCTVCDKKLAKNQSFSEHLLECGGVVIAPKNTRAAMWEVMLSASQKTAPRLVLPGGKARHSATLEAIKAKSAAPTKERSNKCPLGCEQSISSWSQLFMHLVYCSEMVRTCPCCKARVPGGTNPLVAHLFTVCPGRNPATTARIVASQVLEIQCSACSAFVPLPDMAQHLTVACDTKIKMCPACKTGIMGDLAEHLDLDCPEYEVKCAVDGCNVQYFKCEEAQHFLADHFEDVGLAVATVDDSEDVAQRVIDQGANVLRLLAQEIVMLARDPTDPLYLDACRRFAEEQLLMQSDEFVPMHVVCRGGCGAKFAEPALEHHHLKYFCEALKSPCRQCSLPVHFNWQSYHEAVECEVATVACVDCPPGHLLIAQRDRTRHAISDCVASLVCCWMCPERMPRSELLAHMQKCPQRTAATVHCRRCRTKMSVADMPKHLLSTCSKQSIVCGLDGCSTVAPAADLPRHWANACTGSLIAPNDDGGATCFDCDYVAPNLRACLGHMLGDCEASSAAESEHDVDIDGGKDGDDASKKPPMNVFSLAEAPVDLPMTCPMGCAETGLKLGELTAHFLVGVRGGPECPKFSLRMPCPHAGDGDDGCKATITRTEYLHHLHHECDHEFVKCVMCIADDVPAHALAASHRDACSAARSITVTVSERATAMMDVRIGGTLAAVRLSILDNAAASRYGVVIATIDMPPSSSSSDSIRAQAWQIDHTSVRYAQGTVTESDGASLPAPSACTQSVGEALSRAFATDAPEFRVVVMGIFDDGKISNNPTLWHRLEGVFDRGMLTSIADAKSLVAAYTLRQSLFAPFTAHWDGSVGIVDDKCVSIEVQAPWA
ncbi:hypothetical protein BC828DRAFT_407035 [Blastocladiella britannica]|nr:hypothetical protein BC828DRAFT_407035 [Blastocladiella britannica]